MRKSNQPQQRHMQRIGSTSGFVNRFLRYGLIGLFIAGGIGAGGKAADNERAVGERKEAKTTQLVNLPARLARLKGLVEPKAAEAQGTKILEEVKAKKIVFGVASDGWYSEEPSIGNVLGIGSVYYENYTKFARIDIVSGEDTIYITRFNRDPKTEKLTLVSQDKVAKLDYKISDSAMLRANVEFCRSGDLRVIVIFDPVRKRGDILTPSTKGKVWDVSFDGTDPKNPDARFFEGRTSVQMGGIPNDRDVYVSLTPKTGQPLMARMSPDREPAYEEYDKGELLLARAQPK